MRLSSLLGPAAADLALLLQLWPLLTNLLPVVVAMNFDPVPLPNLDLSDLGRVGLAGDFDAISLFTNAQQNENGFTTNGSQSVLTRLPNGAFATLASADASIQAMCPFIMKGGQLAGVVVGGNFTSLGNVEAHGIALVDPNNGKVTPLSGLSGKVATLFCDEATNTVYVGGEFKGANSTNAIAWVGMTGWANLPFAGFNGPVSSIAKASNGNIIFGGRFDGLGNTTSPKKRDQQVVSIASAKVTADPSSTQVGFDDGRNIICKTDGKGGPGNSWLLADNKPGFWKASFQFGFRPTKLRLWNTNQDGRGTKIFRFTALNNDQKSIMNMTFIDPATGNNQTCDARCPLSNNASVAFQDFSFVNVIGMSNFQFDISEWYGNGGGLNGIELFQDDIYAYAVNDFNEPQCAKIDNGALATSTGPWAIRPSGQSASQYLSATFGTTTDAKTASVVFTPDIKQSGNYSVTVYTPGCRQDNSCSNRGRVIVSGSMSSGSRPAAPISTELYQTNDFDKYDQVYNGFVELSSGSFKPTVTLSPSSGQDAGVQVVAQRVRFELLSSTGGLNGLYEFDPNQAVADMDFTQSKLDEAGSNLTIGAQINSLAVQDGTAYIAGNFSATDFSNVFALKDNTSTALPGSGIDGEILTTYVNGSNLYVGGNFTDTFKKDSKGLHNLAVYSISNKAWAPMGAGVNGLVHKIVPILFNVSDNQPENVIAVTGDFDKVLAYGNNGDATVQGIAIWVPSKSSWLSAFGGDTPSIQGQITTAVSLPGGITLYAGNLYVRSRTVNDAVTLGTAGSLAINPLPLKIPKTQSTSARVKRDNTGKKLNTQNVTGIVTGYFHENNGRNVTVLGGHFGAQGTNGSDVKNLLFINGTDSDRVTGVGPGLEEDSVFWSLAASQDTLFAGGQVEGNVSGSKVKGLVLYDLARGDFASTQVPALSNGDQAVTVYAISSQPNTGNVYAGGQFKTAGSLDCPSVCFFNTQTLQWNRPGTGITGVVSAMAWSATDRLVVGGNLTLNGTSTGMATYNTKAQSWSALAGADQIPGPVTALSPADEAISQFWVAGTSKNGSAFLMLYDGKIWHNVGDTLGQSTKIRGIQVLSLKEKSKHDKSDLLAQDQTLLITGQLHLPTFGDVSSALFNGSTFTPFILSNSGDKAGSLSKIFSSKPITYKSRGGGLAVGFVVLIALAIALALIFILVVFGIIAERLRRKREGYMPAPTNMFDKNNNMDRIPPQHLFGNLNRGPGQGPGGAPMI